MPVLHSVPYLVRPESIAVVSFDGEKVRTGGSTSYGYVIGKDIGFVTR